VVEEGLEEADDGDGVVAGAGAGSMGGGGFDIEGSPAFTGQGTFSTLMPNSGFQIQDSPRNRIFPPMVR